jgi:uncharacterized protein (DUF2132 family)
VGAKPTSFTMSDVAQLLILIQMKTFKTVTEWLSENVENDTNVRVLKVINGTDRSKSYDLQVRRYKIPQELRAITKAIALIGASEQTDAKVEALKNEFIEVSKKLKVMMPKSKRVEIQSTLDLMGITLEDLIPTEDEAIAIKAALNAAGVSEEDLENETEYSDNNMAPKDSEEKKGKGKGKK